MEVSGELNFDIGWYDALWDLGGKVVSDPASGTAENWVLVFRDGLRGMLARIAEADDHYTESLRLMRNPPSNPNEWAVLADRHVAGVLFGMDSSVECFVFALNALGSAKSPSDFRDLADAKDLRRVSPQDILGPTSPADRDHPKPGYAKYFPRVQRFWIANESLLATIFQYHNVSKHRAAVVTGGDATTIYLRADPKNAGHGGSSSSHTLQSISEAYQKFINELLPITLQDGASVFGLTISTRPR